MQLTGDLVENVWQSGRRAAAQQACRPGKRFRGLGLQRICQAPMPDDGEVSLSLEAYPCWKSTGDLGHEGEADGR